MATTRVLSGPTVGTSDSGAASSTWGGTEQPPPGTGDTPDTDGLTRSRDTAGKRVSRFSEPSQLLLYWAVLGWLTTSLQMLWSCMTVRGGSMVVMFLVSWSVPVVDKMYQFLLAGQVILRPSVHQMCGGAHCSADQTPRNINTRLSNETPVTDQWGWVPVVNPPSSPWGLDELPFPFPWRPPRGPPWARRGRSPWWCLTSANRQPRPEYSARKQRSCMKANFKGTKNTPKVGQHPPFFLTKTLIFSILELDCHRNSW